MKNTIYDVIVIGAGVSGLSASYHLKKKGIDHVVLERGKIGESWRSQRWDSFRLNSVNRLNSLAGPAFKESDPTGFSSASDYYAFFEEYAKNFDLPIVENSRVISVEKPGDLFDITVSSGNEILHYRSKDIIIAAGEASEPKLPSIAKTIPGNIRQLHTSEYRNAAQLPPGAVLVVGSAQSGVQLAEDLADAGRKVYLSTSMVARVPRWYRGRDIMEWLIDMKFFDMRPEDLPDPAMLKMKAPQITGTGGNRYTISLQSLAKKGVVIMGRTDHVEGQTIFFQPNAAKHVKFADEFSKNAKEMVDGFIMKTGFKAPPAEEDEADKPDPTAACASPLTSLNFEENNITSIIWAVGFNPGFSFAKFPIFDEEGFPKLKDGLSPVPGLYFLGVPWMRGRRSGLIFGMKDDAEFVVEKIYDHSHKKMSSEVRV